jgi:hypothetical protein
MHSRALEGE